MKEFSIPALAEIINADSNCQTGTITGVSIDSRTVKPGDCFFAVPGPNFDGHDFLSDAFAKGAACTVVQKEFASDKFPSKAILRVDDTIEALGLLAQQYRLQNRFKVVAITGSVGKTTTRHIIHHVLSKFFRVFQAPKNFNNNIGLPLTLLSANPEHDIVIAELGTNHLGEITCLTQIARPDIALITNVQPAHLEGFGSLEKIICEKASIAEGLHNKGTFFINADYPDLVGYCRREGLEFKTFGKSESADVWAKDISCNGNGATFTIDNTTVHLPLLGSGNVENALAAWVICSRFEISPADFARALETLPKIPMRAEILQIGTLTIISDCYNANPASMKNALNILTSIDPSADRRRVFICGDMAELGPQTQELHSQLGSSIAEANVRLLLTVGTHSKTTAHAAELSATYDLRIKSFDDTLSACNKLAEFIKDYDIILVKGSRIAKLELAIEKLKQLYS